MAKGPRSRWLTFAAALGLLVSILFIAALVYSLLRQRQVRGHRSITARQTDEMRRALYDMEIGDLRQMKDIIDIGTVCETHTSVEEDVFFAVLGQVVQRYGGYLRGQGYPGNPEDTPSRLLAHEDRILRFREFLLAHKGEKVEFVRSEVHRGGFLLCSTDVLFVFVGGRLWHTDFGDAGLVQAGMRDLVDRRDAPPRGLVVMRRLSPSGRHKGRAHVVISGGRDKGVVAGKVYRVVRNGKPIARIVPAFISAYTSEARIIERQKPPQPGDEVVPAGSAGPGGTAVLE